MLPANHEATRRVGFDDLAGVEDLTVAGHQLPRRSSRPLAFAAHAEPILFHEFAVGQGRPQFLRRGADIGHVYIGRFSHWLSPVVVSNLPAPSGAAFQTWR